MKSYSWLGLGIVLMLVSVLLLLFGDRFLERGSESAPPGGVRVSGDSAASSRTRLRGGLRTSPRSASEGVGLFGGAEGETRATGSFRRLSSSPAAGAGGFLIERNLPPDMEVLKGEIMGETIEGPVVVTGTQGASAIKYATEGTGGSTGESDDLVVFHFGADDGGDYFGEFVVEAAVARATREGIRYQGPLKLKMQNHNGSWYEFTSPSPDAFLLITSNGQRKVFGAPKGVGSFPPVDRHEEASE